MNARLFCSAGSVLALFAACSSPPTDSGSGDGHVDAAPSDATTDPAVDVSLPDSGNLSDAGTDAAISLSGPTLAVIAAMPSNSWKRLPNTAMNAVCPDTGNHYLCDAVMNAWSGGAYYAAKESLVVYGGGHDDSFVNNVFVFDVLSATWSRKTELPAPLDHLAGGPVPPIYRDKRIETCGLYPKGNSLDIPPAYLGATGYVVYSHCSEPAIAAQLDDQQPRSVHSYGNIAVSGDRFYVLGGTALYPSGQAGTFRVSAFDLSVPTGGRWTKRADNAIAFYGTSATAPDGRIYYLGNSALAVYDPAADTWTTLPNAGGSSGYYAGSAIDTKRNAFVATRDGVTIHRWNLADVSHTKLTGTGLPAGVTLSSPGFEYVPSVDRFYAWVGGGALYTLDPSTATWTPLTPTGDLPGPSASGGTYGRFRYSERLGVFVAVNTTATDVFLYKP